MAEPRGIEAQVLNARLGVAIPELGVPINEHPDWFRTVEGLGYQELWCGEALHADAFALLAIAAAVAPSLRVGTGVVPAFTRAPGLLAVSAATLASLAPGRAAVGVGASSVAVVERWGGVPYIAPYQRTRDVVRFLRAALGGQRVTEKYETFEIDGFRLPLPPDTPPALLVAALRPAMLRLAGREAEGAILTWVSPDDVRTMRAHMIEAAGGADRELVVWVMACPSTDAAAVRDHLRPSVAAYLNVAGYAASQEWLGRGAVLAPVWSAWADGRRRDAIAAVTDAPRRRIRRARDASAVPRAARRVRRRGCHVDRALIGAVDGSAGRGHIVGRLAGAAR